MTLQPGTEAYARCLAEDQANRKARVDQLMKEAGVSALLFDREAGDFEAWLLGRGGRALYIPGHRPKFTGFIHCNFIREGRAIPVDHWIPHPNTIEVLDGLSVEELREAAGETGRIGVMHPEAMQASLADFLAECVPEIEFVDMTETLAMEKARLSDFEVALMRDVARRHDHLFRAFPAMLNDGTYERDLVQQIRHTASVISDGDCGEFYHTLLDLYSGKEGQWVEDEPFNYPGRALSYGDLVEIKAQACIAGGYYGVLGRCFSLGEPKEETVAAWNVSVRAADAAAKCLVPGSTVHDAVQAAKAVIAEAGYTTPKMCNIYGTGNDFCVAPVSGTPEADCKLEAGTILAVGFPVAKGPGSFPVACWDAFLVQPGGAQILSSIARTIQIV